MSLKSFNQLARVAYVAYSKRAGGKALDGRPLPVWETLNPERQACWVEAARAIADEVKHIH